MSVTSMGRIGGFFSVLHLQQKFVLQSSHKTEIEHVISEGQTSFPKSFRENSSENLSQVFAALLHQAGCTASNLEALVPTVCCTFPSSSHLAGELVESQGSKPQTGLKFLSANPYV